MRVKVPAFSSVIAARLALVKPAALRQTDLDEGAGVSAYGASGRYPQNRRFWARDDRALRACAGASSCLASTQWRAGARRWRVIGPKLTGRASPLARRYAEAGAGKCCRAAWSLTVGKFARKTRNLCRKCSAVLHEAEISHAGNQWWAWQAGAQQGKRSGRCGGLRGRRPRLCDEWKTISLLRARRSMTASGSRMAAPRLALGHAAAEDRPDREQRRHEGDQGTAPGCGRYVRRETRGWDDSPGVELFLTDPEDGLTQRSRGGLC